MAKTLGGKPKIPDKELPKPAILPSEIQIHDEIGQRWVVDKNDELWPEVLTLTDNGKRDAILPLSLIVSKRGWGWWSCFKTQDEWYKTIGVPVPDSHVLDKAANASPAQLASMLQEFGSYLAFLEAQLGAIAGRRSALDAVYKAAVMVQTANIGGKTSEKAKEAQVLSENETLRQTKRLAIETDMLYETANGMCEAYQRAYDAVSRIVTVQTAEMQTQPHRIL